MITESAIRADERQKVIAAIIATLRDRAQYAPSAEADWTLNEAADLIERLYVK